MPPQDHGKQPLRYPQNTLLPTAEQHLELRHLHHISAKYEKRRKNGCTKWLLGEIDIKMINLLILISKLEAVNSECTSNHLLLYSCNLSYLRNPPSDSICHVTYRPACHQ